jgi:hypothetical protein
VRATYHILVEGSDDFTRINDFLLEKGLEYSTLITINSSKGDSQYHYIIDLERDDLFVISILCRVKSCILLNENDI